MIGIQSLGKVLHSPLGHKMIHWFRSYQSTVDPNKEQFYVCKSPTHWDLSNFCIQNSHFKDWIKSKSSSVWNQMAQLPKIKWIKSLKSNGSGTLKYYSHTPFGIFQSYTPFGIFEVKVGLLSTSNAIFSRNFFLNL